LARPASGTLLVDAVVLVIHLDHLVPEAETTCLAWRQSPSCRIGEVGLASCSLGTGTASTRRPGSARRWPERASFVTEREPTPLPPVARTAGIDLGLIWFASVAASDGTVEQVANLRHQRAAQRRLTHAQRQLARKRKGSANRAKARVRVAVAYRKVRDRRADHHHKLALRLIRENQAVAVEDLCVAGLGRTRLAKSVHDAGWATFVRLLEEKAAQHGRRVVKIGRWEPTSQVCSACGHRNGPMPLGRRAWQCGVCMTVLDRDANAARNILVAAGLAETQNACGGHGRPGQLLAVTNEAGTRRGAA
jgi:putative transposase